MWGVPGSNKNQTKRFMRTKKDTEGRISSYFDPEQEPTYDLTGAVPLEAKSGTVILLHGDLVHYSYANVSPMKRHAYTMHVVESKNTKWNEDNWLQRYDTPFNQLFN